MRHKEVKDAPENLKLIYEILKHVPIAVYHIDLVQLRFLMVNEYLCREFGYSEEEFLSLNPLDMLSLQSKAIFVQRLKAMANGEQVPDIVELEFVTKSGDIGWGRLYIHHIYEGGRITSAYVVGYSITKQKRIYEELANHRLVLERLVDERTSELAEANKQLQQEIDQRVEASEKLESYSKKLEEVNTAMRVLLDKHNEDRRRAEELIRLKLKELIDPYLERLENSDLSSHQRQLVDVIRSNLEDVMGSTTPVFSNNKFFRFSPNELQVVNLIRSGKTTKEIARLLNLSTRTIETYRNSIRKKLDLKHKKINLRTYLSSL